MPLTMARSGETQKIRKVGGKLETKRFLEAMGFVEGGDITIVAEVSGNLIVNVKGSRVAISRGMAGHIMVA